MKIFEEILDIADNEIIFAVNDVKTPTKSEVYVPESDSLSFYIRDIDGVDIVVSDEKGPTQVTIDIKFIIGLWDETTSGFIKSRDRDQIGARTTGYADKYDEYVKVFGASLAKKLGARGWKVKDTRYVYHTTILSFIR